MKEYQKMTWETPSDELADAVENLLEENEELKRRLDKVYKALMGVSN